MGICGGGRLGEVGLFAFVGLSSRKSNRIQWRVLRPRTFEFLEEDGNAAFSACKLGDRLHQPNAGQNG
jgi:hypothetical protein